MITGLFIAFHQELIKILSARGKEIIYKTAGKESLTPNQYKNILTDYPACRQRWLCTINARDNP
jgi:hypothetical protein